MTALMMFVSTICCEAATASRVGSRQSDTEAAQEATAPPIEIQRSVLVLELGYPLDKAIKSKSIKKPTSVQVAVAVAPDALLTSYSALQNATKIAVVVGRGKTKKLELSACSPKDDLALLRPTGKAAKDGEPLWIPLPLANNPEPWSEEHQTLFLDPRRPDEGFSISFDDLPIEDEAMAPGLLGRLLGSQPIVDRAGKLHGVWRWSPPGDEARNVDADTIAELLAFAKSDKKVRPASLSKAPSLTFPLLRWKPYSSKKSLSHAKGQADKLRTNCRCTECHGDKTIDDDHDRIKKGKRRTIKKKITCPECEGTGLDEPKQRWSATRTLAAVLSLIEPNMEGTESVLGALEDGVAEAADLNPDLFRKWVRDEAAEALAARKAEPGMAICFLVSEKQWPNADIGDWGVEVHPLVIGDNHVLLLGANATNVTGESTDAFVTGMIAGTIYWAEEHWVVVERACAVPLKR